MLSSIAGIVGTSSQTNHAAGIAFQDQLMHSQNHSSTHYLSLNLGVVDKADIIALNSEIQRNAIWAECIVLRLDELFSLLEYFMSAQTRQDRFSHVIIGFDRQCLSDSQCAGLLKNPMFSHLPYSV